jgi:hypothetical protein
MVVVGVGMLVPAADCTTLKNLVVTTHDARTSLRS